MRHVWIFTFLGRGAPCMSALEHNEGARHLAQNPAGTSNPKHIYVRHKFLRQLTFREEFIITHVKSEEQHVSVLTHPLSNTFICYHQDFLTNI